MLTRGITLIECMISMVLSVLIVGCVTVIYVTAEKNYRTQADFNTLQDNARYALRLLQTEIGSAGYIGCAHLSDDFVVKPYASFAITSQNKIRGDSESIRVRAARTDSAGLLTSMQNALTMEVSTPPRFHSGDIALISDCKTAEIVEIKSVSALQSEIQRITTSRPLSKLYDQYAEISRFDINTYFIAETKRKTHALYVEEQGGRKTELVDGVQEIAVRYDVEKNGQLVTEEAKNITDWSAVVGLSIRLVMQAYVLKKVMYTYIALGG